MKVAFHSANCWSAVETPFSLSDSFTLYLQVLGEICEQGYLDALKFLKKNGMVNFLIIIDHMVLTWVLKTDKPQIRANKKGEGVVFVGKNGLWEFQRDHDNFTFVEMPQLQLTWGELCHTKTELLGFGQIRVKSVLSEISNEFQF